MVPSIPRQLPSLTSCLCTLALAALNAIFSIRLLVCSRTLFLGRGFPLPATVSMLQLWATTVALVGARCVDAFSWKRLPLTSIIPVAFCFGGVYFLQNVSLTHNSLLFHCLLHPAAGLASSVVSLCLGGAHRSRLPRRGRGLTALAAAAGAVAVMLADPELNWFGAVVAVLYVSASAILEAVLATLQVELDCEYTHLLMYVAPIAAALLTFLCHIMDDLGNQPVWPRAQAARELWAVCAYAALIPPSTHLLAGRLSPFGFQCLGLVKLSVMLWMGYHHLRAPADWHVVGSAVMCLVCLARYTSPLSTPSSVPAVKRKTDTRASVEEWRGVAQPRHRTDTDTVEV